MIKIFHFPSSSSYGNKEEKSLKTFKQQKQKPYRCIFIFLKIIFKNYLEINFRSKKIFFFSKQAKVAFEQARKKQDETKEEYERAAFTNQQSPQVEKVNF